MKAQLAKEQLLEEALKEIDKIYPIGLYDFIYKHLPLIEERRILLEENITDAFNEDKSIEELKAILREYYLLHIRAIKEFNKGKN